MRTLGAAFLCLAAPALAQDAPPGRYVLQPVPDGALRLDTATGAVSLCTRASADWTCRAVADDRRAIEAEVERLARENGELRRQLAERQRTTRDAPLPGRPSERDLEEALGLMERFLERGMGVLERWRRDRAQPDRT
jgi:hypothetical protein